MRATKEVEDLQRFLYIIAGVGYYKKGVSKQNNVPNKTKQGR